MYILNENDEYLFKMLFEQMKLSTHTRIRVLKEEVPEFWVVAVVMGTLSAQEFAVCLQILFYIEQSGYRPACV